MLKRTLIAACATVVFATVAVAQKLPMPGTPMVGPSSDCSDPKNKNLSACKGRDSKTSSFLRGTVSAPANGVSFNDIVNPNSAFFKKTQSFVPSNPKLRMIYDAARGVGIRAGYADEAVRINRIVKRRYTNVLKNRFNFQELMIEKYVIPPVITRINNIREASGQLLYFSDASFEIVKEARLSMKARKWQEYLVLPVQPIAAPQGLSVETAKEKDIWRDGATTGWYAGITEARRGFVTSWNILNRDYGGMQRYHDLANQGVVSLPNIKTKISQWRVTEGGTRAHYKERTLRLKVAPKFKKRR